MLLSFETNFDSNANFNMTFFWIPLPWHIKTMMPTFVLIGLSTALKNLILIFLPLPSHHPPFFVAVDKFTDVSETDVWIRTLFEPCFSNSF